MSMLVRGECGVIGQWQIWPPHWWLYRGVLPTPVEQKYQTDLKCVKRGMSAGLEGLLMEGRMLDAPDP